VIDFILDLKYEKILIMGNHEDLALRFINQDKKTLESSGNPWFYNGASKTYRSIYRNVEPEKLPKKLKSGEFFNEPGYGDFREKYYLDYRGFELPEKYERFLKDLQYVHRESFEVNGKPLNFTFCHGLPRWDQTLEEQRIKTYDELNAYLNRPVKALYSDCFAYGRSYFEHENMAVDNCFVWGRNYSFRYGYQGEVIVHGHTPVQMYEKYYQLTSSVPKSRVSQFKKFYRSQQDLPFLFTRSPWAGYNFKVSLPVSAYLVERPKGLSESGLNLAAECVHFDSGPTVGVEAINVDTGAVYGNCLTAIGLSPKYMSAGLIPVLSARLNKPFSHNPSFRFIHVDGFGGRKISPKIFDFKRRYD
jgi:hypothetical protein